MTTEDVAFAVSMVIAAAMMVVIVVLAFRGPPGVVSWAPPEGSSRWPIYGFFIPWFIAGITASSSGGGASQLTTILRFAMILVVVGAGVVSWRRERQNPTPPPRT